MTIDEAKIKRLYKEAIKEATEMLASFNYDTNRPFSFSDYPLINKKVNSLLKKLSNGIEVTVKEGSIAAWALANAKNDKLLKYMSNKTGIHTSILSSKYEYGARNKQGLESFLNRKTNGLNLSDRVWKSTKQSKELIELAMDIGITEGKSAAAISRDLRNALIEPNRLFRKVDGKLSKAAKEYKPGQGVYRSSYKNAMRLTRTETNMAYRTADHERMQEFDFIKGIEIKLSNNPHHCPFCESMVGKYPKNFKFVGWHVQCMCYAEPILMDINEYNDYELASLKGNEYNVQGKVDKLPKNASKWYKENEKRVKTAKSVPYFIKDNPEYYKS